MIRKSGTIDVFHRHLRENLKPLLTYEVDVICPRGWEKRVAPNEVLFDLVPRDRSRMNKARRSVEGDCVVCPINVPGFPQYTIWASWRDCWLSCGEGEFALKDACWTFFRGESGIVLKQQLFRAEWADVCWMGGEAAQPHWHFDSQQVELVYVPAEKVGARPDQAQAGDAVEELEDIGVSAEPVALEEVDLGDIHLGMGGWTNPDTLGESHKCWQCQPQSTRDLLVWAQRTLVYVQRQLERLRTVHLDA